MAEENSSTGIVPDSKMVHDAGIAGRQAPIAYFLRCIAGCVRRGRLSAVRAGKADPCGTRVREGARGAIKDGGSGSSSFNPALGNAGGAPGGGDQGDDRKGNGTAGNGAMDGFRMRKEAAARREDAVSGILCEPDFKDSVVNKGGGLEIRSLGVESGG